MPRDLTGNSKRRAPLCAVTKAMADAGKAKLETLVGLEIEDGVTDDQIVAEVFQAMWAVYWQQVFELQGKQVKAPHAALILPPTGIVRQ
jgi:hypothetical protein